MITSRLSVLRFHALSKRNLFQSRIQKTLENPKRSLGDKWFYRKLPNEDPRQAGWGDVIGSFMWFWITWHLITEYEELLFHKGPKSEEWTDEELGIPPE